MKLRGIAILVLLAAYVVAFYVLLGRDGIGEPLVNKSGERVNRVEVIAPLLFRPEESLLPTWFGNVIQFPFVDRVPILFFSAVVLAWAAAAGWLAMELLGVRRQLSRIEAWVFSLAVGLSLLSTWTLLLGLFGCLSREWLCIVPGMATVMAAAFVWYRRYRIPCRTSGDISSCERFSPSRLDRNTAIDVNGDAIDLRWLWATAPFVAMILLTAMVPPMDFDVREYHLQAPKEFYQQGRVTFLAHNVYANMALGSEMLSLLSMVLVGDWWLGALVGKTVIAAFTPLCAIAVFAAGSRWHSARAGVVGAIVYISIPAVVGVSSLGLVEGSFACYLFLAVYAVLLSSQGSGFSARMIALGGYLAGAAIATKYPAVLFVFVPLALVVTVREMRQPRLAVKAASVFVAAAVLGCGLWFGKNWLLAGNPTYPLLYTFFGGNGWNEAKDALWTAAHRPHDFSLGAMATGIGRIAITSIGLSPLVVPLAALAWLGTRTCGNLRDGQPGCFDGTQQQTPSSLACSIVSRGKARRVVVFLSTYSVFLIATWWLFTHRIDRFWVPVLPVFALLAGIGACWSNERWWRRVLGGFLAIGLLSNFLLAAASPANTWFIPLDQLRDDPRCTTPWHWYFNNDPEAGRVLVVGDAAVFDLNVTPLYSTCFDDCPFERLVKGKTAEQVRQAFEVNNIGYVFVNWAEIERYRSTYGFTDFVQPGVFAWLVNEGILQPIEPLKDRFEQAYRVVRVPKKPATSVDATPPVRSGRSGT